MVPTTAEMLMSLLPKQGNPSRRVSVLYLYSLAAGLIFCLTAKTLSHGFFTMQEIISSETTQKAAFTI